MRRLAQRRADARTAKDFAASDALRDEIAAAGLAGPRRARRLDAEPEAAVRGAARRSATCPTTRRARTSGRATVSILVEGWPDDLRTCIEALVAHLPAGVVVEALDLGNVDGAGDVLHELARRSPSVVHELHVERPAGWAQARIALLKHDVATVHVWLDPSTVLEGDALTPILRAFDDPTRRRSRLARGQRRPRGRVAVVRRRRVRARSTPSSATCSPSARSAGLAVGGPHPKARFYRNADIEFSLALRARRRTGGRLVVPPAELPVRQDRHRGYHDSDPAYRDAESVKTYNRLLQRFRGRKEILAPRG